MMTGYHTIVVAALLQQESGIQLHAAGTQLPDKALPTLSAR